MKNEKILALTVWAVVGAQPVFACDLCSVYAASEAQGGNGKGFFGGLAEQFTDFSTFKSDGHSAANPDNEFIHSLSSQIFAGYNFNQKIGVQFNLPVIWREYGQVAAQGSEAGIGDVSLIGNFRAYQHLSENFTFNWSVLGGIKFPTGDSGKLNTPDFAAGIGGHDLALGSGSYDGLVGTGFFARWKKIFFTGNMQYSLRTEGDFQHQYANDWTWSGGPGAYLVLGHKYTLALQANVSGESKGKDTFAGVPDDDSAETIVYVGPQINFTCGNQLSAQIGADLPVSYDDSGDQIMPSYRVHAAVTWRF
jgi:hypothetical protein